MQAVFDGQFRNVRFFLVLVMDYILKVCYIRGCGFCRVRTKRR